MSNNKNTAWFESPSKRLSLWREFRRSLDCEDTSEVCKTVVNWWESAPLVNVVIDPANSDYWPTPWEMLHQGNFCENSLALGMSYTIYYANHDIPNELLYITNTSRSFQTLCVLIDNKHLLNYDRGKISILPSTTECLISYRVNIQDIVNK